MNKWCLVVLVFSFSSSLGGCAQNHPIVPTLTPTPVFPTASPFPSATITPAQLPAPSLSPSPTDPMFSPGRYYVYEGEYSFIPLFLYPYNTKGFATFMGNVDKTLTIGLAGGSDVSAATDQELASYFLDPMFKKIGSFTISSTAPIAVDGVSGTSFSLASKVGSDDYLGEAVAIRKGDQHYFFAFGIGKSTQDKSVWEDEGQKAFTTILESVRFLSEAEIKEATTCKISDDPTYGYSRDNPVRVGGNVFGGPAQERAYLDSLSGPGGEAVDYSRVGSEPYGETILDAYLLSYPGISKPVIIFVDEYSFSELSAPKGFTCNQPFPLKAP